MGNQVMHIREAASEEDLAQVKALFEEYFDWVRCEQGINLGFQGAEKELESLPGDFSPPAGCILVAEVDGQVAGCVALRPLDDHICEMKRMFIKPEHRAQGLGKALGERIIQEARIIGYEFMRLDTADSMEAAQGLYKSLGFKPIGQYYDIPPEILKRAVFMELPI